MRERKAKNKCPPRPTIRLAGQSDGSAERAISNTIVRPLDSRAGIGSDSRAEASERAPARPKLRRLAKTVSRSWRAAAALSSIVWRHFDWRERKCVSKCVSSIRARARATHARASDSRTAGWTAGGRTDGRMDGWTPFKELGGREAAAAASLGPLTSRDECVPLLLLLLCSRLEMATH